MTIRLVRYVGLHNLLLQSLALGGGAAPTVGVSVPTNKTPDNTNDHNL
ncbi:hypothetical protein [Paenibacillus alvei]|nr:hypothetical protein [Paenibacillus alvei]